MLLFQIIQHSYCFRPAIVHMFKFSCIWIKLSFRQQTYFSVSITSNIIMPQRESFDVRTKAPDFRPNNVKQRGERFSRYRITINIIRAFAKCRPVKAWGSLTHKHTSFDVCAKINTMWTFEAILINNYSGQNIITSE